MPIIDKLDEVKMMLLKHRAELYECIKELDNQIAKLQRRADKNENENV